MCEGISQMAQWKISRGQVSTICKSFFIRLFFFKRYSIRTIFFKTFYIVTDVETSLLLKKNPIARVWRNGKNYAMEKGLFPRSESRLPMHIKNVQEDKTDGKR